MSIAGKWAGVIWGTNNGVVSLDIRVDEQGVAADVLITEQGRRVTGVDLTAEGRKKIADVFPKHTKVAKCYFRALDGREMETLGRLCGKLREGDAVKFIREFHLDDPAENLDWEV